MKAMILAAGFGKRMMPLTEKTPKPLLTVNDKPLIEYHIEGLRDAGVRDIVINVSHLGNKIEESCGDGSRFGVKIVYSREENPLETAGGIVRALPLLMQNGEDAPFIIVNGDIWTDYNFSALMNRPMGSNLAHLVLVDNPEHHLEGDFVMHSDGVLSKLGENKLTYSGIAILGRALFERYQIFEGALAPLLFKAITNNHVSGEYYSGQWYDIGTPKRLDEVNRLIG